jgi:hypothetical protein
MDVIRLMVVALAFGDSTNWEGDGTILGRRTTHVLRIWKSAPWMLGEDSLLPGCRMKSTIPISGHYAVISFWL